MLNIIYRHELEKEPRLKQWYVGSRLPDIDPACIIEIKADGNEKAHLDELMGISFNKPVVRFYGDIARTVYLNI